MFYRVIGLSMVSGVYEPHVYECDLGEDQYKVCDRLGLTHGFVMRNNDVVALIDEKGKITKLE